jgi:hypothetical protein
MIWGFVYVALLVAITITVLRIGERESVKAVLTVFIGTTLTFASLIVSGSRYDIFSMLVTSVDFVVFAVFLINALTSRRYWTLCLPALQLITCFAHIVKYVAPEFLPRAYSAGQGFWAYPMLLLILMASLWARDDRKARAERAETASGRRL